jgi:hypothetical protein
MKHLAILAGYALTGMTGCAAHSDGSLIDRETRYRLASIDGQAAGDRAFTIAFDRSGGYSASFDCAEHFGRYAVGARLVLEPGATAPGSCDEVDLKTGRPVVRQESFGARFLADQPFAVAGRDGELVLTGRQHRYVLNRYVLTRQGRGERQRIVALRSTGDRIGHDSIRD